MKALYLSIFVLLAAVSATAQIRPVESLPIAVNYSKTIHLIFPSAVKYSQAVTDFVAVDNPENVPAYPPHKGEQQELQQAERPSAWRLKEGSSIRSMCLMPTVWSRQTISCPT